MGFWSDAAGEIWGAVSNPVQTLAAAGTNLWTSAKFAIGSLLGDQEAIQQIHEDTAKQDAEQQDWLNANPGKTEQDYSQYLTDNFPQNFSDYVSQTPTGSANNVVSNSDQYIKMALGIGVVAIIISIFRD